MGYLEKSMWIKVNLNQNIITVFKILNCTIFDH